MGHKDIKMTLRYAHLSQEYKKRGVDILCERFKTASKLPQIAQQKKRGNQQ
jgi:hypothetical protein